MPIPSDEQFCQLAQKENIVQKDTDPVTSLGGGSIWPVVVVKEGSLVFVVVPVAYKKSFDTLRNPQEYNRAIAECPGISAAMTFIDSIKYSIRDMGPTYSPSVTTEIGSLFSTMLPFGRFLGTSMEDVTLARSSGGFATSSIYTQKTPVPCWKPHLLLDKRRRKLHISINEHIRMSTFGKSRRENKSLPDAWAIAGEISCKAEIPGNPSVSVLLSSANAISDLRVHICGHIPEPDVGRKIRFEPPLGDFQLASYAVKDSSRFPFTAEYIMKPISPQVVQFDLTFLLQHQITQPFDSCVVVLPFKNRGSIVSLEETQYFPEHLDRPLIDASANCIVWRLGKQFPTETCSIKGRAVFDGRPDSMDGRDPFFSGRNCFAKVFFQCSNYTFSGLDIKPNDVKVKQRAMENNKPVQATVDQSITADFTVWNNEGAVRASKEPNFYPIEKARKSFEELGLHTPFLEAEKKRIAEKKKEAQREEEEYARQRKIMLEEREQLEREREAREEEDLQRKLSDEPLGVPTSTRKTDDSRTNDLKHHNRDSADLNSSDDDDDRHRKKKGRRSKKKSKKEKEKADKKIKEGSATSKKVEEGQRRKAAEASEKEMAVSLPSDGKNSAKSNEKKPRGDASLEGTEAPLAGSAAASLEEELPEEERKTKEELETERQNATILGKLNVLDDDYNERKALEAEMEVETSVSLYDDDAEQRAYARKRQSNMMKEISYADQTEDDDVLNSMIENLTDPESMIEATRSVSEMVDPVSQVRIGGQTNRPLTRSDRLRRSKPKRPNPLEELVARKQAERAENSSSDDSDESLHSSISRQSRRRNKEEKKSEAEIKAEIEARLKESQSYDPKAVFRANDSRRTPSVDTGSLGSFAAQFAARAQKETHPSGTRELRDETDVVRPGNRSSQASEPHANDRHKDKSAAALGSRGSNSSLYDSKKERDIDPKLARGTLRDMLMREAAEKKAIYARREQEERRKKQLKASQRKKQQRAQREAVGDDATSSHPVIVKNREAALLTSVVIPDQEPAPEPKRVSKQRGMQSFPVARPRNRPTTSGADEPSVSLHEPSYSEQSELSARGAVKPRGSSLVPMIEDEEDQYALRDKRSPRSPPTRDNEMEEEKETNDSRGRSQRGPRRPAHTEVGSGSSLAQALNSLRTMPGPVRSKTRVKKQKDVVDPSVPLDVPVQQPTSTRPSARVKKSQSKEKKVRRKKSSKKEKEEPKAVHYSDMIRQLRLERDGR